MSVVNIISKCVNIYLLAMASLHMAVDWSYLHKCTQAYYHNYTRPTRDQLILSREHTSQCIGQAWIMILTTWYTHVSIVRTVSHPSPKSHSPRTLSRSSSRFLSCREILPYRCRLLFGFAHCHSDVKKHYSKSVRGRTSRII